MARAARLSGADPDDEDYEEFEEMLEQAQSAQVWISSESHVIYWTHVSKLTVNLHTDISSLGAPVDV